MNELEKMVWAAAFAAKSADHRDAYTCAHAAESAVAKFRELSRDPRQRDYMFPRLGDWMHGAGGRPLDGYDGESPF